jgi:hypothetical protein
MMMTMMKRKPLGEESSLIPVETGEDDEEIAVLPDVVPPQCVAPCPTFTDSLVAKQMARLSMADREEVYYDLHGVSKDVDETPSMVHQKLHQLGQELDHMTKKDAYEVARSINPVYVLNVEFQLKFLRAERFDAKKAALRLARHFQAKLDLFGEGKLAQDITQDDLDQDDMEALYSGCSQSLPLRDRAGRLVWVWFTNLKQQRFKGEAKVSWFSPLP